MIRRSMRGLPAYAASVIVCCMLVALGSPLAAEAQQPLEVERELDEAKALYREGRFDNTVTKLRSVISQLQQLRDIQARKLPLADAHLLLGLAQLAMRAESDALDNFRQVVVLDPARTLDPEVFSPRVVALFERARAEAAAARSTEVPAQPPDTRDAMSAAKPAFRDKVLPLSAGTMMRLQFSGAGRYVQGNLVGLDEESFTLVDGENQQTLTFPRDMVTRVDILKRRKGHSVWGMIVGASLGVVAGLVEQPSCDAGEPPPGGECWTRGENVAAYSFGFGLMGGLVGALYRTEEWVEVPANRLANSSAPAGKRSAITIPLVSWE